MLSYSMSQMMVVPALPSILDGLRIDPSRGVWVISAFLLSTTLATPLLGQVGDVLGRARVLLLTLALTVLGSALGMAATGLATLVVARILQGAGGAAFPLAFGQARELLPKDKLPVAIGLISGSFGIGGSLGLVISGPLSDLISWRATFAVSLGMSALSMWCVWPARRLAHPVGDRKLDWRGAIVVGVGAGCVLLAISEGGRLGWLSTSLPLMLVGVLVLMLWWRRARSQTDPVLDVRLMTERAIWPLHVLASALGFCMYSTGFLVPLYVQDQLGESVTTASLVLLPGLLSGLAAGYVAGRMGRRTPILPLLAGIGVMAAGFVCLALVRDEPWQVAIGALLAHGVGLNLVYSGTASAVTVNAPTARASEATGVNAAARTMGGAIGSQMSALIVGGTLVAGQHVYTSAFLMLGVLMLVASTAVWILARRGHVASA